MVGEVADQMIAVLGIGVYAGRFACVILDRTFLDLIAVEVDVIVKRQIGIALRQIGKLIFPIVLVRNVSRIDQLVLKSVLLLET